MTLNRIVKDKAYTLGILSIDGEMFCHTLEPRWREPEAKIVRGRTAIPEGRYPVVITRSPKFKQWLPLLLHVPDFEGNPYPCGEYGERHERVHPRGRVPGKGRVIGFAALAGQAEMEDCGGERTGRRGVDFY